MKKKIKIILLLIKLFNMEELVNNILYNILFLFENEEISTTSEVTTTSEVPTNSEAAEDRKGEIRRNELICKFILSVSIICWFDLTKEQSGYMFISLVLIEVLDYIREKTGV